MALLDRLLIVGTGFMGNALANAICDNRVANEIFGVEPLEQYRAKALDNDCYAGIVPNLERVETTPDIAIVCSPIETVVPIGCELLQRFPDTIVSDIASIKTSIVEGLQKQAGPASSRFVPAHPITGSDRSGPIRPPASIFTDRSCVITQLDHNSADAVQLIESLWTSLGSQVFHLTPEEHDVLLGMTSHMPHAVASALSAALSETELKFCGTGIRDTIRIAKSNPLLWKQIFVHNRDSVLKAMDRFQDFFDKLRHSLDVGSEDELVSILEQGQKNRDALGN